ncbi:MAG: T9SS type A sorting domain-containing protein, partial [Paludibacter sp.]
TTSNIKAFAYGKTLTVRGIKAGARILVTDLTGKMIVNTVSTSDIFTKALYPSIYVVKVVSDNDILRTKVIVK